MMSGYLAAIDFGTSYTVAASLSERESIPIIVPLVEEGRLSSAVALDDSSEVRAGPLVDEVAALRPDRVERTPKRCLDQPDVMLGGQPVQTVDLVAAVLDYVRGELHRQFNGRDPEELRLTHPARWEAGDPRMSRLEAAARQVGFPSVKLLSEPYAAAVALAAAGKLDDVGEGDLVAVYDLGGGTFDTALLSRASGQDFVLAGEPGGDPGLGGEWLDDRLFERLSGQLPEDDEASLRDPGNSADPIRWRRAGFAFRQEIRRAKERLARETSVRIPLSAPFSLDHLSLSRGELERTATPLITASAERFDLFLQRNGKTPADLAAICLVGGSSRLTVVNRILGHRFGRPIATHGDPKSVTALGALSEIEVRPAAARGAASPELSTVSPVSEPSLVVTPAVGQQEAAAVQDGQPGARGAPVGADQAEAPVGGTEPGPAGPVSAPPAGPATPASAQASPAQPGAAGAQRKSHKAAWLAGGGAAAVLVAVLVVLIVLLHKSSGPATPLRQLLPADTTGCQSQPQTLSGVDYVGATSILACETSAGPGYYAFQFDNNADYSAGLTKIQMTGWDTQGANAGGSCPPQGTPPGKTQWDSPTLPARQDQFLECYVDQTTGNPVFLWSIPSDRVFVFAGNSPSTSFTELGQWISTFPGVRVVS